MKRSIVIFIFIIFAIVPIWASSDKIGFVDVNKVFKEFKGFFQVEQEMQKDVSIWRQKAADMKKNVENMRKDVQSRRSMLSDAAYDREMEKVTKAEKEYEAYVDSIWGENGRIQKKYEETIKPMVDVMYRIIDKIAKDEGFSVIMDSSQGGVIYTSDNNDITDRVIEELNYEYGIMTKAVKLIFFDLRGTGDIVKEKLLDVKLSDSLRVRLDSIENVKILDIKKVRIELNKDNVMPNDSITVEEGQSVAQDMEADYFVIGVLNSSGNNLKRFSVAHFAVQAGKPNHLKNVPG